MPMKPCLVSVAATRENDICKSPALSWFSTDRDVHHALNGAGSICMSVCLTVSGSMHVRRAAPGPQPLWATAL